MLHCDMQLLHITSLAYGQVSRRNVIQICDHYATTNVKQTEHQLPAKV